jgi:hypothetical protein
MAGVGSAVTVDARRPLRGVALVLLGLLALVCLLAVLRDGAGDPERTAR